MTDVLTEMKGHVGLHREMAGPFLGEVVGLTFEQHSGVFCPEIAFNVEAYVQAFPYKEGESLWEMGCGVGVLSVVAALRHNNRVVATDFNPTAVDLTRRNAARHGVADHVDGRVGSLFDPLRAGEQFDTIYWNWPFSYMPDSYEPDGLLEMAFCDPGYQLLDTFLSGVSCHLKPDGRLILTFGTLGNRELFVERVEEHGYRLHSLFETTMHNGRTYWIYSLISSA
jgi:release factor glutamine methyltransferase